MSSAQDTLSQIQAALESPRGTAAIPTTLIKGERKAISPDHESTGVKDADGSRSSVSRDMVFTKMVNDSLTIPNLYFQLLPLLLSASLVGGVTPVEQTPSEGDYLWEFNPSLTADNDPDSLALWLGANIAPTMRHYVMGSELKISGTIPQGTGAAAISLEMTYFAQQNESGTFSTILTEPTICTMNAKLARVFMDALWSNLGTTEIAGALRSFDYSIMTGLHPTMNGSSQVYFEDHEEGSLALSAAFGFERNAASQVVEALALSAAGGPKTKEALQLFVEGPQIGAGDNQSMKINAFGYWDAYIPGASNVDGTLVDTVTFVGEADPVSGNLLCVETTTDVATI